MYLWIDNEVNKLTCILSEKKAVTQCESDSRCGGFTFKGITHPGFEFDIFFFHVMTDIGDGGEYLEWSYYLVSRYGNSKRVC